MLDDFFLKGKVTDFELKLKSSQCCWVLLVNRTVLSTDFNLGHKDGSNGNSWEFTFKAKSVHELDH